MRLGLVRAEKVGGRGVGKRLGVLYGDDFLLFEINGWMFLLMDWCYSEWMGSWVVEVMGGQINLGGGLGGGQLVLYGYTSGRVSFGRFMIHIWTSTPVSEHCIASM